MNEKTMTALRLVSEGKDVQILTRGGKWSDIIPVGRSVGETGTGLEVFNRAEVDSYQFHLKPTYIQFSQENAPLNNWYRRKQSKDGNRPICRLVSIENDGAYLGHLFCPWVCFVSDWEMTINYCGDKTVWEPCTHPIT